ncbi:MAG: right-handed parallel beta-helix repeat-containing protein [Acidobacteria bacterium]|nr:right-handed parallel beta-helix repeat-containing protein [Acidobacteriota bacterium]MBI3656286.1 right-handed parallel beta-helix repeat-containing protein [Acidobacteriota bacterium]
MRSNHLPYGRFLQQSLNAILGVFALCALLVYGSESLLAGDDSVFNPRTGRSYGSIREAVVDASPDDIIIVGAGEYPETVIINKAITIIGEKTDGRKPVVIPQADTPAFAIVNPPRGSQVTIDGFRVEVDAPNDFAILAEVVDLTLRNNTINGTGRGVGVKTYVPNSVTIDSNNFSNFTKAISVENDGDWPVSNVSITNNTFETVKEPMLMTHCPKATIANNSMQNSKLIPSSSAITLDRCPGAQVTNNIVCQFHLGIFVISGHGAFIGFNQIGRADDELGSGVYVALSSDVVVESNKVADIGYAIVFDYSINALARNNWMEFTEYGLHNSNRTDPAYLVDARDNWWGASDGPSLEGPGSGVPVNENVIYEPWLLFSPNLDDRKCN